MLPPFCKLKYARYKIKFQKKKSFLPTYPNFFGHVTRNRLFFFFGLNDLVYKEMSRYPITINSTINCIRYWLKLIQMNNSRLPRKAYDSLYDLDSRGKETWVTNIRLCLTQNGFGYAWLYQGVGNDKKFLAEFKERLIDNKWQNVINAHVNDSRITLNKCQS